MLTENSYAKFGDIAAASGDWLEQFKHYLPKVKDQLDNGPGAVLINNFPLENITATEMEQRFTKASGLLGDLNIRGNTQSPVWHVTPPKQELGRPLSYSEQKDTAPLHTDNSYSPAPDQYLSFLAVRPASDGGENIVLSNKYLLEEFRKLPEAQATIKILSTQLFPFSMSHAFYTSAMGKERPIMVAPVFGNDIDVRFQIKALKEGFKRRPDLASPIKIKAVEHFNEFLQAHLTLPGEKLQRGDVMIINNHRAFHSRTAFTDNNRLLLRISVKANNVLSHDEIHQHAKIA